MRVVIRRQPNFRNQHYAVLEFKGKFESQEQGNQKGLIHLGSIFKSRPEEYRLEVGVMDLIGRSVKMEQNCLYTETIDGANNQQKIIVVKGVVTQRILFDRRPIPNMDRASTEPKFNLATNFFRLSDRQHNKH